MTTTIELILVKGNEGPDSPAEYSCLHWFDWTLIDHLRYWCGFKWSDSFKENQVRAMALKAQERGWRIRIAGHIQQLFVVDEPSTRRAPW